MKSEELTALFDQQAAHYDDQQAKMAPVVNGLYFVLDSVFSELPHEAEVLCVGAGTGAEMAHLARAFPGWRICRNVSPFSQRSHISAFCVWL